MARPTITVYSIVTLANFYEISIDKDKVIGKKDGVDFEIIPYDKKIEEQIYSFLYLKEKVSKGELSRPKNGEITLYSMFLVGKIRSLRYYDNHGLKI